MSPPALRRVKQLYASFVRYDYDFIVIGSGFGGSVSALRLADKGYRVAVLEMGRRWTPELLPRTNWALSRWLFAPRLGLNGFFSMRLFRHVMVLHGNAVGGGSITYANTLLAPPDSVWDQGTWAGLEDWRRVMPQHYATARRMLGVVTNRLFGPADHKLKAIAEICGVGHTFSPTEVGVYFGEDGEPPGTAHADPYFGGEGPERRTCIGCGGCMIGCRYGAKNTLDLNYLHLAERKGARVVPETRVVDVRPSGGSVDGAEGYEVTSVPAARILGGGRTRLTCRGVVFAASSLGTQDLLMRLKDDGALPRLSGALGRNVRTNAESLIGIRYPGGEDLSTGIAIGSGIYLDAHTHIEATRYPKGSDAMGFLLTVLTRGRPGWTRIGTWLGTLLKLLLTRPLATLRTLVPFGFAKETLILLVMQNVDGRLGMRLRRPWYWPFTRSLATTGESIPTFIPAANELAIKGAQATGGVAATSIIEILFNIPMTAHCMGGAAMARSSEEGVCDGRNRVFGYRNMYVCDGSMIGANLGVNPSLTITALTEHAMSHVPPAAAGAWD
jgi:cholesterol oxidase